MSKWNEENVLYFASTKKRGFEVSKDAESQCDLRKLVSKLKKSGLIEFVGGCRFKNLYKTTEDGEARLLELKADYAKLNQGDSKSKESKESKEQIKQTNNINGFYVYFGYDKKNNLVYIGTTVQKPCDRWRWHKSNGKDLRFELHKSCESADEMLNIEFELIKRHKPKLNKITNRKQNLNVKLNKEQLKSRVGDKEWCQRCLKRRVRKSSICGYC